MKLDYHVRKAQVADAGPLAVLALQVFLHTYAIDGVSPTISEHVLQELTPEKYAAKIQNSSSVVLVAERDKNLLGFSVLQLNAPCADSPDARIELETLYVQEHFTGKGIGSSLLAEAHGLSKIHANGRLWLSVNVKNERAVSFYRHHQYRTVGTSVFVLGGVGHENHVMVNPPLHTVC